MKWKAGSVRELPAWEPKLVRAVERAGIGDLFADRKGELITIGKQLHEKSYHVGFHPFHRLGPPIEEGRAPMSAPVETKPTGHNERHGAVPDNQRRLPRLNRCAVPRLFDRLLECHWIAARPPLHALNMPFRHPNIWKIGESNWRLRLSPQPVATNMTGSPFLETRDWKNSGTRESRNDSCGLNRGSLPDQIDRTHSTKTVRPSTGALPRASPGITPALSHGCHWPPHPRHWKPRIPSAAATDQNPRDLRPKRRTFRAPQAQQEKPAIPSSPTL